MGLKINMVKTKVLRNKYVTQRLVTVEGSVIEEVQRYIYLGQRVNLGETDIKILYTGEFRQVGKVSMTIKSC